MRSSVTFIALLFLTTLYSSCGSGGGSDTRTFALGFTDFPHARTQEAVDAAWTAIGSDADMASLHFDDGVPWPEALSGTPYNANFMAEINAKIAAIPAGHLIYLSITPLSFSRDSLAAYRGTTGNMVLPAPWDTYDLDHSDVITAFINHCENMITIFDPDYVTYTIEANMLADKAPSSWPSYAVFAGSVYTALKSAHPDLPFITTLQADFYHAAASTQAAYIAQILPFTDYIAMSSYAFVNEYTPSTLPGNWFTDVAALAPDKPFAVGETSWPAETLTNPYPVTIPATEQHQADYVSRLLTEAEDLDAVFVNWFFTRDFDDFWDSDLQYLPDAALIRIWKDTGLYDGLGNPRPGLSNWRDFLGRRRVIGDR